MGESSAPVPAPSSVPVGVDDTRASIARVYDAALGGKDNYAIDREVLEQARAVTPEISEMAWANRNFLVRAVRFLALHAGMRQFLDCGSGLPTAENTHQIAQRVDRTATVVYVDNDPVVLAHGQALLASDERTRMVDADIFTPGDVLGHPGVTGALDFSQPVALLHVSTLHHYGDESCAEMVRGYLDALPSGSYFVLSHLLDPEDPELTPTARRLEQVALNSAMGSGTFRTREQIERLAGDWEIVAPGPDHTPELVPCDRWWPDGPALRPLTATEQLFGCLVARKP
ncbi:SAM-dependent methyltransferase [Saccharomonospora saliphila]|uniref:SAM-dependent methyltransferase n=1 Tax=Saccharomonospora saliphila TaxID=369829 RepID=UPI0003AAB677|nr:SAM-dependent methyltransferase [Saccharomonospora saliphila]